MGGVLAALQPSLSSNYSCLRKERAGASRLWALARARMSYDVHLPPLYGLLTLDCRVRFPLMQQTNP